MLLRLILMFGGDTVKEAFNFGGEELDGAPATRTDHVVVMRKFVIRFIARAPVAESNFACQSRFGEKFKRAVDRRLPDGRVLRFDEMIKVFA